MKTKFRSMAAAAAAFAALVLGVLLFAACNRDAVGTYKFSSVTAEGMTVTAGEEYLGKTFDENYLTVELKADGTFVITMAGAATSASGKWSQEGDTIKFTSNVEGIGEQTIEGTLKDGTLTYSQESVTYTLKK